MPDLVMEVDVALGEVPVNILPLTDDTDFKSRKTTVAYNAAGMDLVWNFVTSDGGFTQTAVTPTSGGAYDWAHQGDGMYTIEIPDSGGASINNTQTGIGWFTGFATGVLPWRGPTIQFSPANVVNALVNGTVPLSVNTTQIEGSDATNQIRDAVVDDATRLDASALNTLSSHDPGEAIMGATDLGTGAGLTSLATQASVNTIDDFLDTEIAAILAAVDTEVAAILADTNELQTDWANGGRLDLLIDAIKAKTDNLPSDPADASVVAGLIAAVETKVDTVDTVVDAVKAKTDNLPSDPADASDIAALIDALPTAAENAAALLDLSNGIETSLTPRQAIRLILAASAGKISGAATTTVTIRNVGDSKDRITATVDSAGNRSAVTVDAT